jgi:hypothetical protein
MGFHPVISPLVSKSSLRWLIKYLAGLEHRYHILKEYPLRITACQVV